MADYNDPIISKYFDLIKASTGIFKAFYQGDPIRIPVSNLPCVIISKQETRAAVLSNAEDEHGIGMSMRVVADIRSDLSTDDNIAEVVAGIASLYEIIEGREEDGTLQATALLNILRHNTAVDTANNIRTDLGSVTRVDYGTVLQTRDPSEWRIEARIDFVCSFSQLR